MQKPQPVSCILLAYGRTEFVEEAIQAFLNQDYTGDAQLVILNSLVGQTLVYDHPRVKIVNLDKRPSSLGACRNIATQHADGEWLLTWDSDDQYLPNHISNFAKHFAGHDWCWMSRQYYLEKWTVKGITPGAMNSVAFTRAAFDKIGGYSELSVGEDRQFVGKLTTGFKGKKIELEPHELSFLYCWGNNLFHISGEGDSDRNGKLLPAYQRAEQDMQLQIRRGRVKLGEIKLEPKLKHDYVKLTMDYLDKSGLGAPKKDAVCFVLLGRLGDICNLLPILKLVSDNYAKPYLMISREFAPLLDGVSYVEPYPVDLDNSHVKEAMAIAEKHFKHVIQAQIWGKGYVPDRQTEAYNMESWRQCGFLHKFNDLSMLPLFDRRDKDREQALVNKLSTSGKPLLLINVTKSISSPFKDGDKLLAAIRAEFGKDYEAVDLTQLRAQKIYDLIGVMDSAAALCSIDTVHLHLAAASDVPVVALTNSNAWLGTAPRCNCIHNIGYNEAVDHERVMTAIRHTLNAPRRPVVTFPAVAAPQRRLLHAVERHDDILTAEQKRKLSAFESWDFLYSEKGVIPCHLWKYPRTAKDIGDTRALPYLKDVLKAAIDQAGDSDIIFWTNDDNFLHPDLADLLRFHCSIYKCCTSQRCEIRGQAMPMPTDRPETIARQSGSHIGRDLFAATKEWLVRNWDQIPDALIGASEFDLHLACLVRLDKGIISTRQNIETPIFPAEIPRGYVVHKHHSPMWTRPQNIDKAPSQRHNRSLFKVWSEKHLPTLKFTPQGTI